MPQAADRITVAVFDYDGTLTDRGSVWPYLVAQRGRLRVIWAGLVLSPRLVMAAVCGGRYADVAKERLFTRVLAGMTLTQVRARSITFAEQHYRCHARADMSSRLYRHRAAGHRLVIVSASPELSIAPVADLLAVDTLLATRLAVDPYGALTGRYDGRNCRGEEKRRRLEDWIKQNGGEDPYIWAYGNSAGDRDMLDLANVGVDVGRLGRCGKLRRFPRLAEVSGIEDRSG